MLAHCLSRLEAAYARAHNCSRAQRQRRCFAVQRRCMQVQGSISKRCLHSELINLKSTSTLRLLGIAGTEGCVLLVHVCCSAHSHTSQIVVCVASDFTSFSSVRLFLVFPSDAPRLSFFFSLSMPFSNTSGVDRHPLAFVAASSPPAPHAFSLSRGSRLTCCQCSNI